MGGLPPCCVGSSASPLWSSSGEHVPQQEDVPQQEGLQHTQHEEDQVGRLVEVPSLAVVMVEGVVVVVVVVGC